MENFPFRKFLPRSEPICQNSLRRNFVSIGSCRFFYGFFTYMWLFFRLDAFPSRSSTLPLYFYLAGVKLQLEPLSKIVLSLATLPHAGTRRMTCSRPSSKWRSLWLNSLIVPPMGFRNTTFPLKNGTQLRTLYWYSRCVSYCYGTAISNTLLQWSRYWRMPPSFFPQTRRI